MGRLALSRETLDRVSERRSDEGWIARAWADPRTRVLVVRDGRALAREDGDGLELRLVSPGEAPDGNRLLLGVDDDGIAYFGVTGPEVQAPVHSEEKEFKPVGLRQAGALLSDRDAGLFTHAVALANWHASHTHCPRCGTPTVLTPGGHVTTCPADGSVHFPRVDPAVIMLVTDPDDRCLLARNVSWPERRMS
ncbi:MAG: NADH pyrophosphatase, partial [Nocardiopsaceae bacterium]|nr:NADH pyrophosphatase [Nocardiopsaceae bacterium]